MRGGASVSSVDLGPDASVLITGVIVVDPAAGTTSDPRDILIEEGRIARVASAGMLDIRDDIPRLDGTWRFATPGLIDVHAHVGDGGVGPQSDATRARALRQFLRHGVTTIFVPGGTGAGDADFPVLRERCRARIQRARVAEWRPGLLSSADGWADAGYRAFVIFMTVIRDAPET